MWFFEFLQKNGSVLHPVLGSWSRQAGRQAFIEGAGAGKKIYGDGVEAGSGARAAKHYSEGAGAESRWFFKTKTENGKCQ